MKQKERCQSCGMPLGTPGFYGTKDDGTETREYCKFCFQHGSFTNPALTVDEMIANSTEFMTRELQFTPEKALAMSQAVIPQLKRWQSVS